MCVDSALKARLRDVEQDLRRATLRCWSDSVAGREPVSALQIGLSGDPSIPKKY